MPTAEMARWLEEEFPKRGTSSKLIHFYSLVNVLHADINFIYFIKHHNDPKLY